MQKSILILFLAHSLLAEDVNLDDLTRAQKIIDISPAAPGRNRPHIIAPHFVPKLHILPIHCTMEEKEYCIITYASCDAPYPKLLSDLLSALPNFFRGHVLYRVGGWPGMELGCLPHSNVPYAFKVCAFLEAYELGYRNILWLDCLAEPLKSLMPLFQQIEEDGCIYRATNKKILRKVSAKILQEFNPLPDDIRQYKHVASGVLGLHLKNPTILALLKEWHAHVERKISFYTFFPEEVPLSILLHKYGLDHFNPKGSLLIFERDDPKNAFFLFDYLKKIRYSRGYLE